MLDRLKKNKIAKRISGFIGDDKIFWYGIFSIALFSLLIWFFVGGIKTVEDELLHYKQIRWFYDGKFENVATLTNIPGYHLVVSLLVKTVGSTKIAFIRFFSLMLGLLSVPLFYVTYKSVSKASSRDSILRTLQFYFFPLFFPFFFLIYTDMFSLALVLASMFLMMKKQYRLSGLFAIFAFLVRQNNVLWLVFVAAYGYYSQFGYDFSLSKIADFCKKIWIFFLGIVGFLGFVYWNGGVAIGDKVNHEVGFFLGNFYFMMFLFFVFFFPFHVENFPLIVRRLRKNPFLLVLPIFLILLFLVIDPKLHIYNIATGFLRNDVLGFIYASNLLKILYLLCVGYAVLSLLEFGMSSVIFLFFPFAILSVIPEWLIEQRYYIIAIAFFMLFRKNKSTFAEYFTLVLYFIISLVFLYGISNKLFML